MEGHHSQEIEELKIILQQLGRENIWRPVVTPANQLLSDGIGDEKDGIISHLHLLDFHNKTVIDLGCNLGYFCFIVKKAGAVRVLGIDKDARIIHGCNLLKKLYHAVDIDFQVQDITSLTGDFVFDVGMMIDFIGKYSIISGMLPRFLDVLDLVSKSEMILSIRPQYRVDKHLENDSRGLLQKYPGNYLRKGFFYAMEYVIDRFRDNWRISTIGSTREKEEVIKEIVVLLRKTT